MRCCTFMRHIEFCGGRIYARGVRKTTRVYARRKWSVLLLGYVSSICGSSLKPKRLRAWRIMSSLVYLHSQMRNSDSSRFHFLYSRKILHDKYSHVINRNNLEFIFPTFYVERKYWITYEINFLSFNKEREREKKKYIISYLPGIHFFFSLLYTRLWFLIREEKKKIYTNFICIFFLG